MNTPNPTDPGPRRSGWLVPRGMLIGVLVNVTFCALLGAFLGVVIVSIAWVTAKVATQTGYMPYNGSVGADLLALTWRSALFFCPAGLFTGMVIGGRLGWSGGRDRLGLASVGRETATGVTRGLFFLVPLLLLTVLPLSVLYSELYQTVDDVTVTTVRAGRPVTYVVDLPTAEGYKQLSLQDSAAEPRVQKGDTLRVVHRGKIWEGELLLPGQPVPEPSWSVKAYFLAATAAFSFLLFGGLWATFYLKGAYGP